MIFNKRNREKRLKPRRVLAFWCGTCDAQLVREWKKCPVCKRRNGIRRNKK